MKANIKTHKFEANHVSPLEPQDRTVANILNGINNGDSFPPKLYTALAPFLIAFLADIKTVVIIPAIPIITPPKPILFFLSSLTVSLITYCDSE